MQITQVYDVCGIAGLAGVDFEVGQQQIAAAGRADDSQAELVRTHDVVMLTFKVNADFAADAVERHAWELAVKNLCPPCRAAADGMKVNS
ncbi:hypothetical protein DRQ26_06925, partial [bacterium]